MSNLFNLEFYNREDPYMDNYGFVTHRLISLSYKKALQEQQIQKCLGNNKLVVGTKIGILKWFPVIDCDLEVDKKKCLDYLNYIGCNQYVVLQSSQSDKYWVIVDKIMRVGKCIKFMKSVIGNDIKYISLCENYSSVHLRAFLKDNFVPKKCYRTSYISEELSRYICLLSLWYSEIINF